MTAPTFTKDELERIESSPDFTLPMRHLAAFAFAQMEGKEAAEAESDRLGAINVILEVKIRELESERDEARRELQEAEEAIRFVAMRLNEDKHKPRDPAGEEIYEWKAGSAVLRARERERQT